MCEPVFKLLYCLHHFLQERCFSMSARHTQVSKYLVHYNCVKILFKRFSHIGRNISGKNLCISVDELLNFYVHLINPCYIRYQYHKIQDIRKRFTWVKTCTDRQTNNPNSNTFFSFAEKFKKFCAMYKKF